MPNCCNILPLVTPSEQGLVEEGNLCVRTNLISLRFASSLRINPSFSLNFMKNRAGWWRMIVEADSGHEVTVEYISSCQVTDSMTHPTKGDKPERNGDIIRISGTYRPGQSQRLTALHNTCQPVNSTNLAR